MEGDVAEFDAWFTYQIKSKTNELQILFLYYFYKSFQFIQINSKNVTCDWLALKVDKVFDADVVDIEDGDGDVQLISVSLTLSPDTEDNELLLTPCVS